jgi:hypothetical protein
MPSSGSVEFEPSRVTVLPSSIVWSGPASAHGAAFTQLTFTIEVAVDFRPPVSVTVNWKVSDSPLGPTFGAVKVGVAAVGSDRVTWVPANRVHWYETIPSSGSVEFEPSRVTVSPSRHRPWVAGLPRRH